MHYSRKSLAALLMVLAVVASGCEAALQDVTPPASNGTAAKGEPVSIGFSGPLSGEVANFGINAKAAVDIAVEEVNAAGGIAGKPLKVVFEDDQCDGKGASNAVSKLINVDKVPVVLGSICSPATLSYAPMAEQAKVVGLSFCSTAPKISQAGDYIFRDVPSDLFQASYAAKYAYDLGKRKAAIVYVNNDWGMGLEKAFTEAFQKLGGTVLMEEGYDPTSKDLRAQMTKVKGSDADLLYFAAFPDGTTAGLKQAKELGIAITIMGGDVWDDNKMWTDLGDAGEGALFTVVGTNSTDAFKTKMKEKLKSDEITYCSNYAYDAVKVIAQVMNKVGVDSTMIKDELYKTTLTGGVGSASLSFDANGDPVASNYVIKLVKGGKAEQVK